MSKKNAVETSRKGSFLGKLLGVAAGYAVANVAGTVAWYALKRKEMAEHENENNLMQAIALGKNSVVIKGNTDNAYIACLSGCVDINFEGEPEKENVYINLFSVLGKVTLNLPEGAKLELEGEGRCEKIQDNRLEEEEGRFTVHVVRQNTLTELVVNNG